MSNASQPSGRTLRLWPGVAAAVIAVVLRFLVPLAAPDQLGLGILGALVGMVVILAWWLFFSRAPWPDRLSGLALIVGAAIATRWLAHPSVVGGMMGLMLFLYALPGTVGPLFVAAIAATRRAAPAARRAAMAVAVAIGCGVWLLIRTDGLMGSSGAQLQWRWTPTAEERLLAQGPMTIPPAATVLQAQPAIAPGDRPADPAVPADAAPPARPEPVIATTTPDAPAAADPVVVRARWDGFRGPRRDGVVGEVRIETDWTRRAPTQIWKQPVGPGWSSFAVDGDVFYTQEQRGEHEMVTCYRLATGEAVWQHRDAARFYESNGGAGPRATPTLHEGRVYTLGATGILNALDARTGAMIWSRNAQSDTGADLPGWGFAGSPLVVGEAVIVATSGRLAAYDLGSGDLRWTRETGAGGYSSPQRAAIGGQPHVLLLSGGGITSVAPADGAILWQHAVGNGVSIVQPSFAEDGDVLLARGDMMGGTGITRLAVTRDGDGWRVEERWASRGLKPYFNDFVVHEGHAYGFDGSILSAISLADGERAWKGGRYGQGQLVLLAAQDALLVVGEDGQLALVSATPDGYREIARAPGIEGKTWNHPVVVGDVLLVRNGEEMAAFRLPIVR